MTLFTDDLTSRDSSNLMERTAFVKDPISRIGEEIERFGRNSEVLLTETVRQQERAFVLQVMF